MDVPGLSLFQGAESIKLNSTQERIELEEEALEDQRRRNEELKNELQNAFNDLDEDFDEEDDSSLCQNTIDGSANCDGRSSMHNIGKKRLDQNELGHNALFYGGGYSDGHGETANNHNADLVNDLRRLKNVLSSKSEELKNVTAQSNNDRIQYEKQIDELKKRLAIADAEKERAHMSRKQTHELVVESKQKLAEREELIVELNAKIKALDARNLELVTELERTKMLLSDVQHKYHMVERNANFSSEKYTDDIVKQINDRHAAQTDMMQQQINTMRTKLEERDSELKRLMIQNNELQRSREAILIDKSDTINQLTQKLECSQRQCQNLIMKNGADSDLVQENVKLMRSVTALEQQTDEMQRTISELTMRLENTTAELEQITDSAIYEETTTTITPSNHQQSNGIQDTPVSRKPRKNLLQYRNGVGMSSTPMLVEDRLNRLKQEFNRCLADQKNKRQEIFSLKEQLASQNAEIERLKADENRVLVELTMSKEKADRLANRLKMTEMELEDLKKFGSAAINSDNDRRQSSARHIEKLDDQLNQLQKENDNLRNVCDHLNETIKELEDERDKIDEKYRDACQEIAELQKKLTQLKSRSDQCLQCEKEKFLSKDAQQECVRLKELYIQLNGEKEDVVRRLREIESTDIHKELMEQRNVIANLERSLQLAELKCSELTKILDREKIDYEKQIQNIRAKYELEKSCADLKDRKNCTNSCTKCIDLTTKIAKFDIENLQLQTACSGYLKEIHDLKKSLVKADQNIAELKAQITLKEEHDKLIVELKKKAKQFEEFMRNQSPSKSHSLDAVPTSQRNPMRDQCVSTEDLLSVEIPSSSSSANATSCDRTAEKRIREDMARAMAVKVKAAENHFKDQCRGYEEHIESLSIELNNLQHALSARDKDVSALKKCILSERAEIKTILEQKDAEANEMLQKQHNVLMTTRSELEAANKRIEFLNQELEDCGRQIQVERQSMNKLMDEWKMELAAFSEREESLTERIHQMNEDHKISIQNLNEKYVAAKKTAANYKKYSEDKEKHIERESERIKMAYEAAVKRVTENMEKVIKEHEKKANKRISELQTKLAESTKNRQK